MGIKSPKTLDIWETKQFTVTLTMRDSGNTVNSGDCIFMNTNASGATVSNNNTSEITFAGTSPQVNDAIENTNIRPKADTAINYSFNWAQTDNDPTPGSNPVNANLPINISSTHAEWSINTPLTYNEDDYAVWNLGSITDERPTYIDSNIQYTITATLSNANVGVLTGSWVDQTGGVYNYTNTKANCNILLAATNFTPAADYTDPFTITYAQNNDTDSKGQGSTVINMSALVTHAEHSITSAQSYSTNTTATWNMGSITDERPDNIDANIQYTMGLQLSNVDAGTFTGWDNAALTTIPIASDNSSAFSEDGNTLILGDWNNNRAVVYTYNGAVWSQEQILVAGDAVVGDWFGNSVALSADGNTAAVGAPERDDVVNDSGAVYIFTRTASVWTQQQKIQQSTPALGDYFGWGVELDDSGDTVVVGAPGGGANNWGETYIFTRTANVWTEDWAGANHLLGVNDNAGRYVDISGDGLYAVSCVEKYGSSEGAVLIYKYGGVSWGLEETLYASDITAGYLFGCAAAISDNGEHLLVGSNGSDTTGADAGTVYYFTRSGSVWTEQQIFQSTDIAAGDQFGLDVDISADGATATIATNGGPGYIFTRTGTTWSQYHKVETVANSTSIGANNYCFGYTNSSLVFNEDNWGLYTYTDTKANCNTELTTVEFVPLTGLSTGLTITYEQNQDTDGVDQGTQTINITNV